MPFTRASWMTARSASSSICQGRDLGYDREDISQVEKNVPDISRRTSP